jgi:EpsI family protein
MDEPELPRPVTDPNLTRRNMLIGAALLGVSATAYARLPKAYVPRMEKDGLEHRIPYQIGAWRFIGASGLVTPPPDPLSAKLYSNVLTRYYARPDQPPLGLLIAYSNVQDGLLQLHRPEICYPAGGYHLSETQIFPLSLGDGRDISVRAFTADGVSRSEHVLYWTRLGDDVPTSWAAQRWAVAKANLRGEIPDGILVRLSLVDGETLEGSAAVLGDFARELLKAVGPDVKRLLVGGR